MAKYLLLDGGREDSVAERTGDMMERKVLKFGIMSRENYKKRTMSIARGKYRPTQEEPKVWFESLQSMAQVLSNENQQLLKTIREKNPMSLKELEIATGRKRSNLSRTLHTMSRYGIVELIKHNRTVQPVVTATDFSVEFGLDTSSAP